jgi:hypothetical protein
VSNFAENTICEKKITLLSEGSISKLFPAMFPGIAGKLKYMHEVTWEKQKVPQKPRGYFVAKMYMYIT